MSYAVVLAPIALDDLVTLPAPLQNLVEVELTRLGSDPVGLSEPSHFPFIPSQMYRIEMEHGDFKYVVRVLFKYSQDERSIYVIGLAITKLSA